MAYALRLSYPHPAMEKAAVAGGHNSTFPRYSVNSWAIVIVVVVLVVEVYVLNECDVTAVVLQDIVTVQSIAVLVEVVRTLGAFISLDRQDRLPDLRGVCALGVVDGQRQYMHRVKGPGAEMIRRDLVSRLIFQGELFGGRA